MNLSHSKEEKLWRKFEISTAGSLQEWKKSPTNNFLGCAKYFDDETGYGIDSIIYTMIDVDRD